MTTLMINRIACLNNNSSSLCVTLVMMIEKAISVPYKTAAINKPYFNT